MTGKFIIVAMGWAVVLTGTSARAQVTFPDLLHRWSADNTAEDAAGSADGVLNGAVSFSPGRFGQAFEIDAGEFITFGTNTANVGTSDFTISLWFRTDGPIKAALITKRDACFFTSMIDVRTQENGSIGLELSGAGGAGYTSFTAFGDIHDGQWHHLAYRREGTTLTAFIDGCLAGSDTTPLLVNFTNTAQLTLGRSPCTNVDTTEEYDGAIDEVQIYTRALSEKELDALAEATEGSSDLSGDGLVNGADLGMLLLAWGDCRDACCPADLNGDGEINGADLGMLLLDWTG